MAGKQKTEMPEAKAETAATVSADDGAPKFTKEQILASRWFSHRRDILSVLLSDEEQYSHGEIDRLLVEFTKGKVN